MRFKYRDTYLQAFKYTGNYQFNEDIRKAEWFNEAISWEDILEDQFGYYMIDEDNDEQVYIDESDWLIFDEKREELSIYTEEEFKKEFGKILDV